MAEFKPLIINNGRMQELASTDDLPPGTGVLLPTAATFRPGTGIAMWAESFGGAHQLRVRDSLLSRTDALQYALNSRRYMFAQGTGGTTFTGIGCALAVTGTATAPTIATTNAATIGRRTNILVTVAAATAVVGVRTGVATISLGALGGFDLTCTVNFATGAATSTKRLFIGLTSNVAAPTDVDPSTLPNLIGFGFDAADASIQFMSKTGAGAVAKTATSFAKPTADEAQLYKVRLTARPGGTTVFYTLTELVGGTSVSGSTSTNLPAAGIFLGWKAYASVGGTSSVIGLGLHDFYCEEGSST